ncbi:MAG TPA: beta-ketoacyl-ACP synthase II [Candidatus Eremiobacteraeota bacterium]|nr:MAG: 3-oxoacyl-(acyl-carrier-protein) synthase 2 [bacterium ADurb.Bin363]HPZ07390.1 beta-ketoacyl-ACP synthase II [Candidatus Eremiobacteraeota bacterium]
MYNRRVVVTGIGTVCCNGVGKEIFWKTLKEGVSNIDKISSFDAKSFYSQISGEARDFKPTDYIDFKEAKRMDRFNQFAIACTKLAVEDAKLTITDEISSSVGVLVGSCFGGLSTLIHQTEKFHRGGSSKISPFFIPMLIANMVPGQISISFNARGPNYSIVSACATGAHCIGRSYDLIKRGVVDIMITGGTDAVIIPLIVAGFGNMKALSSRNDEPKKACRPFDKRRDGFIIAEGSAILIVEALDSALSRGANIYGEIIGFGMNADGHHITAPDPEGAGIQKAMRLALKDAGIKAENVDYINAHGTSTPYNDRIETYAIKKVFGDYAYKLAVSSNKSMLGHTLGASGALEFAATLLTLKENIIPPTINYEEPDPDCDLDYVPNKAREQKVDIAMCNSFGFGGANGILIGKKYIS